MSNIRPQAALVKASPKTNALALQRQADFITLEQKLAEFPKLSEREKARRLPQLKQFWAVAQKHATVDDIDLAITLLLGCFPHLERSDLELLAPQLTNDIRTQRPTQYELEWACAKMRRDYKWFSIADFLATLRTAKRRTTRVGWDVFGHGSIKDYDKLFLDIEPSDHEFLAGEAKP